jgi:hypothetical protein
MLQDQKYIVGIDWASGPDISVEICWTRNPDGSLTPKYAYARLKENINGRPNTDPNP